MVDDDGREGHWEIDPSDPEQKRKIWALDPVYAKTNNNKFVEALADEFVVGAELDPELNTKLILVGAAAITAGIVYYNSQANSSPAYPYPQQNDFTPPYRFNEEQEKAPDLNKTYVDKNGKEYKYKPPKNWNGKRDKQGNYPTKGQDKWSAQTTHGGTHAPHFDITHPDGTHTPVYLK